LNPAFTGKFEGVWRLAANNRTQWRAIPHAFETSSFSIDFPIMKNKIPEGDVFGLGLSGLTDASGDGALKLNYGSASLSYHKALDESGYNTIGAGFQGTYSNLTLNTRQLHFEDELTQNGWFFNPNQTNSTIGTSLDYTSGLVRFSDNVRNYFDVNAGILYSGSSNGENNYYIGLSMYHINRPKLSYKKNNAWYLSNRTTIHGGGSFAISDVVGLNVSFIQQFQNKASETVLGGTLSINANGDDEKPTNVYVGSWMRVNDAVIPYLGLEIGGLRIGATYDVNISGLKSATKGAGGTEFSIIYIKRPPESKGIPCPRF
jgi:type IX secretion system PorP/SprF family membrane protein